MTRWINLKKQIIRALPSPFVISLRKTNLWFAKNRARHSHARLVRELRKKNIIKIAFFVVMEATWKCDKIYRLFDENERYEPVIIICPRSTGGMDRVKKTMELTCKRFEANGYKAISAFDKKKETFIDVSKEINPDVIFFGELWDKTYFEYSTGNFRDALTCYIPYGRHGLKKSYPFEKQFAQLSFFWKIFFETEFQYQLYNSFTKGKGVNAVYTGYPGSDILLDKEYVPLDVWKIKDRSLKRIIWAPHFTIPGYGLNLNYSTFMSYHGFFLEMACKYKNDIQISFKPHPGLRQRLSLPDVWGEEKTNAYYEHWEALENGQLNEGAYIDLFLTSDAMILDSPTMMVDYYYMKKPIMYLPNSEKAADRFRGAARRAFALAYKGKSKDDIESFIRNVVIGNEDPMAKDRVSFFNETLKKNSGKSASETVFDILNSEFSVN